MNVKGPERESILPWMISYYVTLDSTVVVKVIEMECIQWARPAFSARFVPRSTEMDLASSLETADDDADVYSGVQDEHPNGQSTE
ncbi:MAG: hypothetical protein MMC33_010283 [Icmadophila ericetorum]|nr:hypothetical protein [Icmadophila ericetorum]